MKQSDDKNIPRSPTRGQHLVEDMREQYQQGFQKEMTILSTENRVQNDDAPRNGWPTPLQTGLVEENVSSLYCRRPPNARKQQAC